jgi:capsular exopolysaccharide synthesis family protein
MSRIHEALKQAAQGREPALFAGEAKPNHSVVAEAGHGDGVEWLNRSMPTSEERAATVSDFSGRNDLWQRCRKPGWRLDPTYSVVSNGKSFAPCAEQFSRLRARLYQLRENEPLHTLLVTSSLPAEGKTFVALNLALAIMRQHNRYVLLIDGDLRRPKLATCLGVPGAPGLTEFLRGVADESSVIQTDTEGELFFISAGSSVSNPTELLSSERLESLFRRMAGLFDWVIIDAPPVLPVSDASVLAGRCDGVVVVIRAGSTGYDAVGTALQELRGKRILGVVLNCAEEEATYGAYSYYGGNGMDKK